MSQENNVLLQQSASQLVAETHDRHAAAAAPLTPCSLAGLGPALSGAALGLLFGSGKTEVFVAGVLIMHTMLSSPFSARGNTSGSAMFGHLWGFLSRKPLSTPVLQTAWQSGLASAKVRATMLYRSHTSHHTLHHRTLHHHNRHLPS